MIGSSALRCKKSARLLYTICSQTKDAETHAAAHETDLGRRKMNTSAQQKIPRPPKPIIAQGCNTADSRQTKRAPEHSKAKQAGTTTTGQYLKRAKNHSRGTAKTWRVSCRDCIPRADLRQPGAAHRSSTPEQHTGAAHRRPTWRKGTLFERKDTHRCVLQACVHPKDLQR